MNPPNITLEVCSHCGEIAGQGAHGHFEAVDWRWLKIEYFPASLVGEAMAIKTKALERAEKAEAEAERLHGALMDTPQWQHAEYWKAEVERLNKALDNMRAEYETNLNELEPKVARMAQARLYGEKMLRDRDPDVQRYGEDLLQIIDGEP